MRLYKKIGYIIGSFVFITLVYLYNLRRLCREDTAIYPTVTYTKISKLIHMTAKDEAHVYKEIKGFWISRNPGYKYKIYNDYEIDAIVRDNMDSEVYEAFKLLPRPVLKADYFRYIILYLYGGIYSDTDTICLRPIDTWSDGKEDVDMILGLEGYEPDEKYVCEEESMARDIQFTQWTIMSRAKHPILLNVINKIKEITPIMINKTHTSYCDVLNWTGPGIWTDAVMDYLNLKNTTELDIEKGKLINGVYILPNTGFNGPDEEYDPEAKVQHLFWGSWKNHTMFKFYQEIDRYFYFRFRC